MGQLLYAEESYAIRGTVFEVYRKVASGFLEAVYQERLEMGFKLGKVHYLSQQELRTLDCFRVFRCLPWSKKSFSTKMPIASGTVVCHLSFPRSFDEHPRWWGSREQHAAQDTGTSHSPPLAVESPAEFAHR